MKLYFIDWRYDSPKDNFFKYRYFAELDENMPTATTIRLAL